MHRVAVAERKTCPVGDRAFKWAADLQIDLPGDRQRRNEACDSRAKLPRNWSLQFGSRAPSAPSSGHEFAPGLLNSLRLRTAARSISGSLSDIGSDSLPRSVGATRAPTQVRPWRLGTPAFDIQGNGLATMHSERQYISMSLHGSTEHFAMCEN